MLKTVISTCPVARAPSPHGQLGHEERAGCVPRVTPGGYTGWVYGWVIPGTQPGPALLGEPTPASDRRERALPLQGEGGLEAVGGRTRDPEIP